MKMKCYAKGCRKDSTSKVLFLNRNNPIDGYQFCDKHTEQCRKNRKAITKHQAPFRIYRLPK